MKQQITAKSAWIFFVLWNIAEAVAAFLVVIESRDKPSVLYWIRGPLGYSTCVILPLLTGVAIIIALEQPKTVSEGCILTLPL